MKKNTLATAIIAGLAAFAATASPPTHTAQAPSVFRVNALAGGESEVLIYGPIGDTLWDEGITALSIVETLARLPPTTMRVRINSDGGSVAEGLAIYNALREHPARKIVTVDGLAASVASLVAMAGDEVIMPANALMMVHAPWAGTYGNAPQLRDVAAALDKHAHAMAVCYAAKTGKSVEEITAQLLDGKDHYLTAPEAVAMGLANRVADNASEQIDENTTAAAALLSYISAISKAPAQVCATLRRKIQAAAIPRIFAAFPAALQRSVVDNIEDQAMKQACLQIMAAAAGGLAAAPAPAPAPVAALAPAPAPAADPVATAMAALAARNTQVRGIFAGFRDLSGMPELEASCLADPSLTMEQIQGRVLARVGSTGAPLTPNGGTAGRVDAGLDEADKFRAAATNAICARVRTKDGPVEKPDGANPYRGMGLQALVRHSLVRARVDGVMLMDNTQLASRVFALHGTSDFPLILSNSANKILRAAYEAQASTWQIWCDIGEVSDFKENSRLSLGSFSSLAVVPAGAPYDFGGTMAEASETITAQTLGRGIAMTRQMIVNDDLGAFTQRARALGAAARRTVNEDVYAFLVANAATADGGARFNATAQTTTGGHANLTGTGTAISVASIAVGEALMAAQKDPGLKSVLNLAPRYLLAPRGKKQIAWDVLNSPTDISQSNSAKRNYAASLGLELVTDAELDKASATAWYLAADKSQAPALEVSFLNGQDTPVVEENVDFKTDAILCKVRLDYGVGGGDWRGAYKNNGA